MERNKYYNPFNPRTHLQLWAIWQYVNDNISTIRSQSIEYFTFAGAGVAQFPIFNGLYLIVELEANKVTETSILQMTYVDEVGNSITCRAEATAFDSSTNQNLYNNLLRRNNFLITNMTGISGAADTRVLMYKLNF